jgi:Holliday junction resolvase-like predicted endonuclease
VNFQAAAGRQGRAFEDAVERQLVMTGWTIVARHRIEPTTGVEIDRVALDPSGRECWIECKGSWESQSQRNGCNRTDTTKKLIANAALLATVAERPPYIAVTSDRPRPGSAGARWLDIAIAQGWITSVQVLTCFGSWESTS